jgi:hypothetical protein
MSEDGERRTIVADIDGVVAPLAPRHARGIQGQNLAELLPVKKDPVRAGPIVGEMNQIRVDVRHPKQVAIPRHRLQVWPILTALSMALKSRINF